MVIDTSALIAVLLNEPESLTLVKAMSAATRRIIGAPTLVEATAVMLARKGSAGDIALSALIQSMDCEVVEMSVEAADLARSAYARYGKGIGNPGVLNFGDCLSYGVARALGQPLLFVGNDFGATDVLSALQADP